jgi:tetratricopeptide (TPR) repeat protein
MTMDQCNRWSRAQVFHGFTQRVVVMLGVMLLLQSGVGMAADKAATLVIPDYPSAKDQYNFAMMYQKTQFMSAEAAEKKQQIDKIAQCYQRVIDNFPRDTEFTPRAVLQLGDCQAMLMQADKALMYYRTVLNDCAEDEYLHARALFATGQMMDMKKDYVGGKAIYKEVMDRFSNSSNPTVREITKRASVLYFQVREQPVEKKKWSLPKLFGRGKSTN